MPSSPQYTRTFSWPPSTHHLENPVIIVTNEDLPDIDDDPYSHFISPLVEEDDPFDSLSYSAGIEELESNTKLKASKFSMNLARKWAHYVSKNHEQLHDLYHTTVGPQTPPEEEAYSDIEEEEQNNGSLLLRVKKEPEYEPTRGRAAEMLARPGLRRSGKRASRTLSGKRHSWREPSVDLFTVPEEGETGAAPEAQALSSRGLQVREVIERARL